jgi:signal peptide peptidase SppA
MQNKYIHILTSLKDSYWHMLPGALENILNIVYRDNEAQKIEALLARDGEPFNNVYRTIVRDGVAIIPISGPIFPKANLFTEISGATSLELLAKSFAAAMEDPSINAIIFDIDSPGGSVFGLSEFADLVRSSKGVKPIKSFVSAQMASAAYFIGSAADEIITAPEGIIGAIGTILNVKDTSEKDAKLGVTELRFTSKVSPKKNLPLTSAQGKEQIQSMVDSLGQVFVEAVAKNRNVSVETVLQNYGQGDVFVGQQAVDAGMADRLGTLENLITELSDKKKKNWVMNEGIFNQGETNMKPEDIKNLTLQDLKAHNIGLVDAIKAELNIEDVKKQAHASGKLEGVKEENDRIKAIESIKNPSNAKTIDSIKFDTTIGKGEAAIKVLEAMNAQGTKLATDVKNDAEDLGTKLADVKPDDVDNASKVEKAKVMVSNIAKGGSQSRPKNFKIFDKVKQ